MYVHVCTQMYVCICVSVQVCVLCPFERQGSYLPYLSDTISCPKITYSFQEKKNVALRKTTTSGFNTMIFIAYKFQTM